MTDRLLTSLQYLKGVGPKLAKTFLQLELDTVRDLIYFFPRTYEDRRQIPRIAELKVNESMFFVGEVQFTKLDLTKNRFKLFKANIYDGSGSISVVWFNQPFMQKTIKQGMRLYVSGKVEYNQFEGEYQLACSDYDILDGHNNSLILNRVVPVYNLTKGLSQKKVRQVVHFSLTTYLKDISDPYSDAFRHQHKLMRLTEAVYNMHYPKDREAFVQARKRLAFDDFFFMQLVLAKRRFLNRNREQGIAFKIDGTLYKKYLAALPYQLTNAQKQVISELGADMEKPYPMNRLVQGDVGAGKTEIAVAAMMIAFENGYQSALMAPTEILAEQHYKKLTRYLEPLGLKVELLTGRLKARQKRNVLEYAASNHAHVLIGTHALIQDGVSLPNLGLAIVDEQHRFGVMQRATLKSLGGNPDLLVMTATPIPRSLSLTVYGDLEKSILNELPPGRIPIKTLLIKNAVDIISFLRTKLMDGQQAYYVLPLVEESEKLDLKTAVDTYEHLREVFPEFAVGLIHGKMKPDIKDDVMQQFRTKQLQLLVATTVIEVGIDVPDATIMVIEHAERFGLAQLHQLRGRVGRGHQESFCILVGNPKSEEGKQRLKVMTQTNDGFKIAEFDLKLRGPGDFYGVKQSGLPSLTVADFVRDEPILLEARCIAGQIVEADPELALPEHASIRHVLSTRKDYQFSRDAMN